jgi:uncharacterized glyoxalase superfamily protein PhnB
MKLYVYLNYGGNCAQAFRFYEEHLGGRISSWVPTGRSKRCHNTTKRSTLHNGALHPTPACVALAARVSAKTFDRADNT